MSPTETERTIMETKYVEAVGFETEGAPLYNIRWSAIFAGLAVGLGIHLLLMLIGMAAGLAVFGTGGRPDGSSLSVAAAVWNTISMVIAALIGGYVAARASGLRRSLDGMLHGVVSWGATMIFFVALTGSLTGNALSGLFGMASSPVAANIASGSASTVGELLGSLERGDRSAAVSILRDRFGMTEEQAGSAADRAMAMTGSSPGSGLGAGTTDEGMTDAARAASVASGWLALVILLSLVAGAGGGVLGARGARKRALPGGHGEQRLVRTHNIPPPRGGIATPG
jgi:hypothetical protein